MEKVRCKWCNLKNPLYVAYHDEEWGVPTYDDNVLHEFLILEAFQAGLSWETILNKRENFRRAFENYDKEKICNFDEEKIAEMLNDASIIRNRRKIEAAINNTKIFMQIQEEWGSFAKYIWHFTDGQIIYENDKTTSSLSDEIAKDMKKRGMKFMGSTTVYAFLQSIGIVNSHMNDCFLYRKRV